MKNRPGCRTYTVSVRNLQISDVGSLSNRIIPRYKSTLEKRAIRGITHALSETQASDLLSLQWPSPPKNILMIKKKDVPAVTECLIQYAKFVFFNIQTSQQLTMDQTYSVRILRCVSHL